MTSSAVLMSKLQLAHQQACRGFAQVLLVTGDAGLGKTHLVQQFMLELTPDIAGLHIQWYAGNTPQTVSQRIFSEWSQAMDQYYQLASQRLLALASELGLPWQAPQLADELQALVNLPPHQGRAEASQHIRQNLPWLKKLNPNLKAQADALVDGLIDPWLNITFEAARRWRSLALAEAPQALARQLVDECLWMHGQLHGHKVAIVLWIDQLDTIGQDESRAACHWLKTVVQAINQAESMQVLLGLSCRNDALSRVLAPDIFPACHQTLLLGSMVENEAATLMSGLINTSQKPVTPDFWPVVHNMTQGNPVWIKWLAHFLLARPALWENISEWSPESFDHLGVSSADVLVDWVLVPLQLNPDVQAVQQNHPNCLSELLSCLLSQPQPFEAPAILERLPLAPEHGFTLLKALFSAGLLLPAPTVKGNPAASPRYVCESRLMLEAIAARLTQSGPVVTTDRQQASLTSILEPAILSGDLDVSQLQDLLQLCHSLPNAEALKADLQRHCETALDSKTPRVRLSALTALALSHSLTWQKLQSLLQDTQAHVRTEAWRYASVLPPVNMDDETLVALLSAALSDPEAAIRASALRCVQQSAYRLQAFMDIRSLILTKIQDANPWVRAQALQLCTALPADDLPTGALLACGDETHPAAKSALLAQWERLDPSMTVPIILTEIETEPEPAQRSRLLAFIRQAPLPAAEPVLRSALRQTRHPELIWTLVNKLSKEAEDVETITMLQLLPTQNWPDWLKTAYTQQVKALPLAIG